MMINIIIKLDVCEWPGVYGENWEIKFFFFKKKVAGGSVGCPAAAHMG